MQYTLGQEQINGIEEVLQKDILELGVHCVCLIDMAGNIIANLDNGEIQHDVYSLAALAAGNFGAVSAMAEIVGENEFSQLPLFLSLIEAISQNKIKPVDPIQTVISIIGMCVYPFIAHPILTKMFPDTRVNSADFLKVRKVAVYDLIWVGIKA